MKNPTPEMPDAHESAAQLIPWLINGTLPAEEVALLRAHLDSCATCRDELEVERRLYERVRGDGQLVLMGEASFDKLMARIEADDFAAPAAAEARSESAGRPAVREPPVISEPAVISGTPTRAREQRRDRRILPRRRGAGQRLVRAPALARWLAAAVVIEALGLGLGAWTWKADLAEDAASYRLHAGALPTDTAPYRTLTTSAPRYGTGARVRVVFRSDLSLDQLQRLLRRVDAHIVDGPTEARVYTLGFGEPVPSADALHARIAALRADPHVLFAEPAGDRPP